MEDAAPESPRKRAKKKATKKKAISKRAVVEAAKRRGHLQDKKNPRLIADLREFWTPIATQKKTTPLTRLAKAELAFYDGGTAEAYFEEISAILGSK